MWSTDTYWFDVALAMTGLMLGHLYFGRFEEHKPRWRRLGKSLIGVAIVVGITAFAGRAWTYAFLAAIALGILVVHGWWLPRNGVNGWTAEPRDRYYELIATHRAQNRSAGALPAIALLSGIVALVSVIAGAGSGIFLAVCYLAWCYAVWMQNFAARAGSRRVLVLGNLFAATGILAALVIAASLYMRALGPSWVP